MKTIIVYYSRTGNNAALAEKVAERLGADRFELIDANPRTMKTIVLDMLFNRYPPLKAFPENIGKYDLVVFMGPIWMFGIASPMRTCFKELKKKMGEYAFVSINGGALGPNTKIAGKLVRRLGRGGHHVLI
jgi:flavodoxin